MVKWIKLIINLYLHGQGHDQSNDTEHGVCGIFGECGELAHVGATEHMAGPTGGREVQAAGDVQNGGGNKERNGGDEEDDKVL